MTRARSISRLPKRVQARLLACTGRAVILAAFDCADNTIIQTATMGGDGGVSQTMS